MGAHRSSSGASLLAHSWLLHGTSAPYLAIWMRQVTLAHLTMVVIKRLEHVSMQRAKVGLTRGSLPPRALSARVQPRSSNLPGRMAATPHPCERMHVCPCRLWTAAVPCGLCRAGPRDRSRPCGGGSGPRGWVPHALQQHPAGRWLPAQGRVHWQPRVRAPAAIPRVLRLLRVHRGSGR